MRLTDVIYAFPDLLFFIIVMVALRDTWIGSCLNGLFLLFIALAIVNWVGVARLVRGQVLSLKQKEFVEAARSIGAKSPRIMTRHLLPNTLGVLMVSAAFMIPGMIITEAILGYLGLGLRPATDPDSFFITSWGALLLEGQTAINAQPWMLLSRPSASPWWCWPSPSWATACAMRSTPACAAPQSLKFHLPGQPQRARFRARFFAITPASQAD